MKTIQLTKGKVVIVDDEDFEWLNQFKWQARCGGKNYYASRTIKKNRKNKLISMSREILKAPLNYQIDHINGNSLDNRKENLRIATLQQNGFNRIKAHKNNKLGIKGVCWSKNRKKFRAKIIANKKEVKLGFFNVLGDADDAYRKAEKKHFGKFARNYND